MFGLSFIKDSTLKEIRETITGYQRTLEDIGWINLSVDQLTSNELFADGFGKMLKRCKIFYYNNPLAGHWVHLTTAFVFGEGVTKPKSEDANVQEVIDQFWDNPDNQLSLTGFSAQHLLSNKLQYEGNIFLMLFDDEEGNVIVRILNTEEVVDIVYDEDDPMRPLFYKVRVNDKKYNYNSDAYENKDVKYQYVPDVYNFNPRDYGVPPNKLNTSAYIYHVKINCDIRDKFGVPDLYRGLDWMKAHKDMGGDIATLIKALSKFAWKKKIKGTQAQVNTIAGALNTKTSLSNIRNQAGQTQVENDGVELQAVDVKTGGVQIGKDGMRQMELMVCAASGIFHHYYGDPSTGNLATATSMELPMVKKFSIYQSIWSSVYESLLKWIILKKVEVGLFQGKIEIDNKTKRKILSTDKDLAIDIDFPPIIEDDLQKLSSALKTAKDANLIGDELAARIFMVGANVNNIDDELENLKQDMEKRKTDEISKLEQTAKINKQYAPTSPLKEAIDAPLKPGTTRFARKYDYTLQRLNGYKKSLAGTYKQFASKLKTSVKIKEDNGKYRAEIPNLKGLVEKLTSDMQSAAKTYFPVAIEIGSKYTQAHLKKDLIETSLYEADNKKKAKTLLREMLDWNDHYLTESLKPDITSAFQAIIAGASLASESAILDLIAETITSFEPRVEQYVGAFWTVEEKAVKAAGEGTGLMVNFAGADDDGTCEGCKSGVEGNPWPIETAPVPGEQNCLGRCRHALQIIEGETK